MRAGKSIRDTVAYRSCKGRETAGQIHDDEKLTETCRRETRGVKRKKGGAAHQRGTQQGPGQESDAADHRDHNDVDGRRGWKARGTNEAERVPVHRASETGDEPGER